MSVRFLPHVRLLAWIMFRQPIWRCVYLCGLLVSHAAFAEPARPPSGMLADADLHDVVFIDSEHGWAVGDRGVIWQTDSGGGQWRLADSPTTARLRSICFIDSQTGWIAGGWIHPGTHRSSAVLLRTENGGQNWTRMEVPALPALRRIWFQDARMGWALGDNSALYSAGWFHTRDGGHSWESVPCPSSVALECGAWRAPGQAVLFAVDSSAWQIARGALTTAPPVGPTSIRPRAVQFSRGRGWLVGDQGVIRQWEPGTTEWIPPIGKLPTGVANEFDWSTVATHGDRCWIAGSPGSRVLHSPDGGRSWRLFRTGQTLPIHRLFFQNERLGWAIGPYGRILATRDGGQTWRLQLSAGERASLFAVHRTVERLPLEIIARAAADEGHLAVAIVLEERATRADSSANPTDRFHDALSAVGATAAAAGSSASLEELVVRQLRIWRPDVVLTDNLVNRGGAPGPQTAPIILQAARRAADPAVFPQQLVVAGLEPWSIQKLYGAVEPGEPANVTIDTNRLSLPLGSSLAEYTVTSRELLAMSSSPVVDQVGCRLLWSKTAAEAGARDLFGGVASTRIGENRRPASTPPPARIEGLLRSSQQLRDLEHLVTRGVGGEAGPAGIVAQLEPLVRDHEPAAAGKLLFRTAQLLEAAGLYPAADDCLAMLVDRLPDHELTDAALLWLVQFRGSAELQHAFGTRQLTRLPSVAPRKPEASAGDRPVQPATFLQAPLPVPSLRADAPDGLFRAVQTLDLVRETRPALAVDPRIQFPLASVQRRLGRTADATRTLTVLANGSIPLAWRFIARRESDEIRRAAADRPQSDRPDAAAPPPPGQSGQTTMWAAITGDKPLLDGELADACWQNTRFVTAPHADSSPNTEVAWSYDDEFLYIALRCAAVASTAAAEPDRQPRVRDAQLHNADHVTIAIDVDRDYHTAYEFAVDCTGRAHDACGGNPRWNPKWFVAAAAGDSQWRVEAAIPHAELAQLPPVPGDCWCIRFERVLPSSLAGEWPYQRLEFR